MAKRFKLNIGDLFTIPLNENEVGFGQIIDKYDKRSGGFRIAVYDIKCLKNQSINIKEIVNSKPLLVGYTFDSLLSVLPKWKIIGNCIDNIEKFVLPYFRLGTPPGDIYIVNHRGERLKEITEETFNNLEYKSERAPIGYENALKAHFGIIEWKEEDYDELLYKHTLKSNEIAREVLNNSNGIG